MININETFETKAEAEEFRDRYYRDYHPQGYGTHISIDETPEGKWRAHGSRAASCD